MGNTDNRQHQKIPFIDLHNRKTVAFPKELNIHQRFEEQAALHPQQIAITDGIKQYSYERLNNQANQLARVLQKQNLPKEAIVAVMMDRSFEQIVCLLAVLKAGAVYLPIDPTYPKNRIQYTLEDSQSQFLLCPPKYTHLVGDFFTGTVIGVQEAIMAKESKANLNLAINPKDLGYIIYTSGTSGRPKGVMIEHQNVIRLLVNEESAFDFDSTDVWTMFHNACFDFSVWEMYGALLFGGRLVIVPSSTAKSPKLFLKLLADNKVTVLNQTPGAFYHLIKTHLEEETNDLSLRYVIFGGEALKPIMLKSWYEKYPNTKLINMYGITETTVHVTFKQIRKEEIESYESNIGKVIPTLSAYVLDHDQQLVPYGVPGELCIGGIGLARGYLNRVDLTAQKFVTNPLVEGERIYRSGDRVRLLMNGDLEYLGRIDRQVKIRGFRIEIGEIEKQLLSIDAVKNAVVMVREEADSNKYICAYIEGDGKLSSTEVRKELLKELPQYMIPAYFHQIDRFPLTENGKVNYKALPDPKEHFNTGSSIVTPKNEMEIKMLDIWKTVLEHEQIGVEDNFFEVGGNSFKTLKVISRLDNIISVEDIFEHPTIRQLSNYILSGDYKTKEFVSEISKVEEPELSIICIPYGGGDSSVYRPLAQVFSNMDKNYAIFSVALPGRGYPTEEEAESTVEIVEKYVEEILEKVDTPIVVYGHCVGSTVAYEMARQLEACGIEVKALCLGGIIAPPKEALNEEVSSEWDDYSDQELFSYLRSIGGFDASLSKAEVSSIIQYFRNDTTAATHYYYSLMQENNTKLQSPLYCFIGDQDPVTEGYEEEYKNWEEYAQSVSLEIIENGGHYFINEQSSKVAERLDRLMN